jgi:hypothetical protein
VSKPVKRLPCVRSIVSSIPGLILRYSIVSNTTNKMPLRIRGVSGTFPFFALIFFGGCSDKPHEQELLQRQDKGADEMVNTLKQLQVLVSDSIIRLDSRNSLVKYLSERWDRHAEQGPLVHQPVRRSYVEAPWMPNPENLYVALFPSSAGTNLLDFEVFVWYASSIHQD